MDVFFGETDMFQETKQKVVAGIVATLVLGMGGYWLTADENQGGTTVVATIEGPRQREKQVEKPLEKERPREKVDFAEGPGERPVRPDPEDENNGPPSRRPSGDGKFKIKKPPRSGC